MPDHSACLAHPCLKKARAPGGPFHAFRIVRRPHGAVASLRVVVENIVTGDTNSYSEAVSSLLATFTQDP